MRLAKILLRDPRMLGSAIPYFLSSLFRELGRYWRDGLPVARFIQPNLDSHRWIDAGLKMGSAEKLVPWDASDETWSRALRPGCRFYGIRSNTAHFTMDHRFQDRLPIERQTERVSIFSEPGQTAALQAFAAWKSALVADLGPPQVTKQRDLSWLGVGMVDILIWESPVARASIAIIDSREMPCASFILRHKLIDPLEQKRAAAIARGDIESFED